jgi:hypothetical protein
VRRREERDSTAVRGEASSNRARSPRVRWRVVCLGFCFDVIFTEIGVRYLETVVVEDPCCVFEFFGGSHCFTRGKGV